jgi:hypothetical protein
LAVISANIDELPGARIKGWMAEAPFGSYPLQAIATSDAPDHAGLAEDAFLVLSLELELDAIRWLGAAPVFVRR